MHQGLAQVALLAALGEVVDPVGGDPVDRVADHVDEPRLGDDRVHALGDADVLRVGRVVGRRFAAHLGLRRRNGARYQLEAARVVALGDEEVELLRHRHRDLGVQAQVVVKPAGAALLRPDHDQVRQRAGLGPGRHDQRRRLARRRGRAVAAASRSAGTSPTARARRRRGRRARISPNRRRRKDP